LKQDLLLKQFSCLSDYIGLNNFLQFYVNSIQVHEGEIWFFFLTKSLLDAKRRAKRNVLLLNHVV